MPNNNPFLRPIGLPYTITVEPADYEFILSSPATAVRFQNTGKFELFIRNAPVSEPIAVCPAGGTIIVPFAVPLLLFSTAPTTLVVQPLGPPAAQKAETLKLVAHNNMNTGWDAGTTTSHTGSTSYAWRTQYFAPQGISSMKLVWGGFVTPQTEGETPIAQPLTIQSWVEYPSGTFTPLFYNGQTRGVLNPSGELISDLAALNIPAGASFWLRTYLPTQATTDEVPANHQLFGSTVGTQIICHEGFAAAPASGTATIGDGFGYTFEPFAVIGTPLASANPSLAVIGDSIVVGQADIAQGNPTYTSAAPALGFVGRACFEQFPAIKLCHGGYHAAQYQASGLMRRLAAAFADVFLFELGVNDLLNGASLATLQAATTDACLHAQSLGLITCAVTLKPNPTVTGPNYGAFIAGRGGSQTPASNDSTRIAYNQWLRTLPAGIDTILDIDAIIDPLQSGVWPVASPIITSTASTVTIQSGNLATLNDSSLTQPAGFFANPADGLGPYIVFFTGGANVNGSGYVWDDGPGTLQITNSYGQYPVAVADTNPSGYIIADIWSKDGVHPTARTYQRVANQLSAQIRGLVNR